MLITIIILSIILLLLIAYLFINNNKNKKEIEKARIEGSNSCFDMILQVGYSNRVNNFKGCNKVSNKNGIVFVGDSLTENYNVYEYFKGYDVYNRGIGGDTTEGLLKRMNESVIDLDPKIVVLLIGINDFELVNNSTVESIFNNIEKIIDIIHEKCPKAKIILESMYHVCKIENEKIDKASIIRKDNAKVDKVNSLIKNIKNVNYIDMNSLLCDENGNLKLEYTIEGLHVNNLGYEVITKRLKEEFSKM